MNRGEPNPIQPTLSQTSLNRLCLGRNSLWGLFGFDDRSQIPLSFGRTSFSSTAPGPFDSAESSLVLANLRCFRWVSDLGFFGFIFVLVHSGRC